jgi:hypothetical protein
MIDDLSGGCPDVYQMLRNVSYYVDLDRLGSCRSSGPMDLNAQPGDEEDP